MSSFLEEIIKSTSSYDYKSDSCTLVNHDKLEARIINEMNSIDLLTTEDGAKNLNSNIDNWMLYLRKNILEEFEGMKIILKDVSKNIIVNEIRRFENEMVQLKNSNIDHQNKINTLKHELCNYKGNIKSLSIKLSKNKNKFIEAKYMFNWRLRKEQVDRQRFCEKISEKFYQTNIMRKAFYNWKSSLEMTWKNRNNSKIERQAQSVCQQLITEYEKQIIELRSEISKLQDENASMQTSRSATQDAVKKALMRGVCALNMETMSILNQNGILIDKEREGNNNNCFQNIPSAFSKKEVPYLNKNDLYDDQPRFSLNKYNRNNIICNDNVSFYSNSDSILSGTDYNGDDIPIKKLADPQSYLKGERNQYQTHSSTQNNINHQKIKSNLNNENNSIPKSSLSRNSAITVQAGNPTGSHTHSSNSLLNISVRRHVNDSAISPHAGPGYQSDNNTDRKSYKK